MCGLAGFIKMSEDDNPGFLAQALKKLAYRGSDSYGFIVKTDDGQSSGRYIGHPKELLDNHIPEGDYGIAHTRWATHGEATVKNTHPIAGYFTFHDEPWYCVHNGIIENADEIRKQYLHGVFKTDTDTEVIPVTFGAYFNWSWNGEDALRKTLVYLKGDFTCLLYNKNYDALLGLRKGQPLYFSKNGYIASDPCVFKEYADEVYQVPDNSSIAMFSDGCIYVNGLMLGEDFYESQTAITFEEHTAQKAKLNETKPFMLTEIEEQVDDGYIDLKSFARKVRPAKVCLYGAGSSYNAALFGKYLFERAGIPAFAEYATEISQSEFVGKYQDCWNIAITQSGFTWDTIEATKKLLEYGCSVSAIVNRENTLMHDLLGKTQVIPMGCGEEIGIAATKTFYKTCYILKTIADRNGIIQDAEYFRNSYLGNKIDSFKVNIKHVAKTIVKNRPDCVFVLGSGMLYPIALEGALKIKEVGRLHAEGMNASEVKHGPLALITERSVCIFLLNNAVNKNTEKLYSNIKEVQARGAKVLTIEGLDYSIGNTHGVNAEHQVQFSNMDTRWTDVDLAIVAVVPLQLLSYYLAVEQGLDPDRINHLAKCVSV